MEPKGDRYAYSSVYAPDSPDDRSMFVPISRSECYTIYYYWEESDEQLTEEA